MLGASRVPVSWGEEQSGTRREPTEVTSPPAPLTSTSSLQGLDITTTECSRAEDKAKIIAEVKGSAGVKRMQVSVCAAAQDT